MTTLLVERHTNKSPSIIGLKLISNQYFNCNKTNFDPNLKKAVTNESSSNSSNNNNKTKENNIESFAFFCEDVKACGGEMSKSD
jgi:hypothetical protein